jgi:hypothetical protein
MPPGPFDHDRNFINQLLITGALLKTRDDPDMRAWYWEHANILESPNAIALAGHFPEFFSQSPRVTSEIHRVCQVALMPIDPGALNIDYTSYIRILGRLSLLYSLIVGFPFWHIFPLWLRISGVSVSASDYVKPTASALDNDVYCVVNPARDSIFVRLRSTRRIPRDSVVLVSRTRTFDDAIYVTSETIRNPIEVPTGETYLSVIGIADPWAAISVTLPVVAEGPNLVDVDVSLVHDQFVADMAHFAVRWSAKDTEELLAILPRAALQQPTFSATESIARGSAMCTQFPVTVVLLRALILHHFNFVRFAHKQDVAEGIWASYPSFISAEDAADALLQAVASVPLDIKKLPTIIIDRKIARVMVSNGFGKPEESIIAQLSARMKVIGAERLRSKQKAWNVIFKDEPAIDAGGPARELITETAASIFEPTSRVVIPSPDQRRGVGQGFIPWQAETHVLWGIGVYLGIVVRTGLSQDLPFVPLFWKFLVGEKLGETDVVAVDHELGAYFAELREGSATANWIVPHWDGTPVLLPGHRERAVLPHEIESFIESAIRYRLTTIRGSLVTIRRGFRENVGFKKAVYVSGAILSRAAQGMPSISVEHLKAITKVMEFTQPGDAQYIDRFWKAVARFTEEERKLLLKFITTLPRLPNAAIFPGFRIVIVPLVVPNPDQTLPMAATCFQKLHLPKYSSEEIAYRKILVAVQYCQTMENK